MWPPGVRSKTCSYKQNSPKKNYMKHTQPGQNREWGQNRHLQAKRVTIGTRSITYSYAKPNSPNHVSTHGQEHYIFTQNERAALCTLLVSNTKGKDQLAVKTTLEKHLQVSSQEHNLLMFADKLHPMNLLISKVHKFARNYTQNHLLVSKQEQWP